MSDQAERLRNRMNGAANSYRCKTIAIVSGKGGVGKSTTVLNFSIELQKRGKKVLIFDFDVGMGNIDILLGKQSTYTIVHLFRDFIPIHDMIELGPKGLSYIAGGSGLNEITELKESHLQHFLTQYERLLNEYDYIFFDLGAGITESSLALILAADECFVITTPEPTSIADAYSVIKHIVMANKELPISILMNRTKSNREGEQLLNKFSQIIFRFLNKNVRLIGSLPKDEIVSTAVQKQTPYILLKENAPISKAIKQIVAQYLQDEAGEEDRIQPNSFVQKFKQLLKVR